MGNHTDSVLGHPEMVRAKSYHTGAAALAADVPESFADNQELAVCNWEGFLGSCAPSIIDTALLPDLVIVIQLAGNNVLTQTAGVTINQMTAGGPAGNASFSLNNLHLTVECIGLGSGVYDQLISRSISERGFLEIPFKQFISTLDSHTGSTRFHVSTACLDRIWVAFRASTYAAQGLAIAVSGHKSGNGARGAAAEAAGTAHTIELGTPGYDTGGVMGINDEKYRGKFHNMAFGSADATIQLQINGSLSPGFAATVPQMYALSKNAVDVPYGMQPECKTLAQYRENFSVYCHRLCLPGSDVRSLTGQDTRGINLQGVINTNLTGVNVVCFLEMTSVLQLGNNKQFSIIQ
jgi:hypothetical protein